MIPFLVSPQTLVEMAVLLRKIECLTISLLKTVNCLSKSYHIYVEITI